MNPQGAAVKSGIPESLIFAGGRRSAGNQPPQFLNLLVDAVTSVLVERNMAAWARHLSFSRIGGPGLDVLPSAARFIIY
ncbi:hypothetical protein [Rhodoblastus sp.]|uniref:hypothetical protein n=1 Tax=Rhodoblastus sp. TaxID=1962975 RepID=UPI0026106AF6|nr:hypothetical protein [Rhodoblastus sp.]